MFQDATGRSVGSVEEAESFVWRFITENLSSGNSQVLQHSHDFDLFLPWLLEIVSNMKVEGSTVLPVVELQRLYMDAAWSMVMQGYLRPGPRTITGDSHRDGYGKGYSLMPKGWEYLRRNHLER